VSLESWPEVEEQARVLLAGAVVSIAASSPSVGAVVARPFSHLPPAEGPAVLRIEASGPPSGWVPGPNRIELADGGAIVTHLRQEGGAILDRRAGLLRGWWAREEDVATDDRSKPFSLCLAVWLADRGLTVAHAGCVARDGRAVLLTGPGGSGKSTAALSCAARGFVFLGDDQVALAIESGRPVAHSMYGTARLDRASLTANPELACGGPVLEVGEDKPILVVGESAARLASAASVVAIAIVGRGDGGLSWIPRTAALRVLAQSTLARRPLGAPAFERLAELANAVRAVAIEANTPHALPALVDQVLAEA
jgi:hypothetical protein